MNNAANSQAPEQATGHAKIAVVCAILAAVFASLVSNSLPVFLAVIGRMRELDEGQIGLVAMAELGGFAVAIVGCALLPRPLRWLNWRRTVAVGLVVFVVANLLATADSSFGTFFAIRCLAGLGAGLVVAIAYAVVGEGDSARLMAILAGGMLVSGAVVVQYLAPLADAYGAAGFFGLYAAVGLLGLTLVPFIPTVSCHENSAANAVAGSTEQQSVSPEGWLAVASVFVHFCGIGAVYAFISTMGVAWGGHTPDVDAAVSKMLFSGGFGVALVAVFGSRFGPMKSLVGSYVGVLLTLLLLLLLRPVGGFLMVCMLFGFTYNILVPFQFDVVTRIDPSPAASMLVSAAMLAGVAIGPAIAGYLVTSDYLWVNSYGLAGCGLSLALIVAAFRWRRVRESKH